MDQGFKIKPKNKGIIINLSSNLSSTQWLNMKSSAMLQMNCNGLLSTTVRKEIGIFSG